MSGAREDGPPGAGWTPPATVGGNWVRVNAYGIYETWPHADRTRYETVLSDDLKAFIGGLK